MKADQLPKYNVGDSVWLFRATTPAICEARVEKVTRADNGYFYQLVELAPLEGFAYPRDYPEKNLHPSISYCARWYYNYFQRVLHDLKQAAK